MHFQAHDHAQLLGSWAASSLHLKVIENHIDLKCIQNSDDRELLSFALTAVVNLFNKLKAVRAKLNGSLSSIF